MIKIGIIGCGKIAQVRHLPEYSQNKDVKITALFDLNQERAAELAQKYGAVAYDSIDALLDSDVDAVSVCTSNSTHAEISMKALKKGKDVLCEKPMAITLDECILMDKVAKENDRVLMIGQNQRLTKAHIKAHDLISEGAIGDVISFTSTFGHGGPETWSVDPGANTWFFDKSKAVMGAMADLGIHKTDLILYLLDDEVKAVTAKLKTLDKRDANGNLISVDDNAFCIYEMKKGAVGIMRASWTFYGSEDNSTVVYGTKGIIKIYVNPHHSVVLENGNKVTYFDTDQIQTNDNQTSSGVIDEFVRSIQTRDCKLSSTSVLPAMKAVFGAIESSEKDCRIEL